MTNVAPVQQQVTDGLQAARGVVPRYRILAFGVDVVIVLVTLLPLMVGFVLLGVGLGYLIAGLFAALCVYVTASVWLTSGLTIGKALFGLTVLRIDGSEPARDVRGLLWAAGRHTAGYVVVDVFGLAATFALASGRDRCPHDRAFDSMVVLRETTGEAVGGPAARVRDYDARLDEGIDLVGERYGWSLRLWKRLAKLMVLPATLVVALAGKGSLSVVGTALGWLEAHVPGFAARAEAAVPTPPVEPISTKSSIALWGGSGTLTVAVVALIAPQLGPPDLADVNVVFSSERVNQPATSEIHLMKADGTGERQLTTNEVADRDPDLFDDRRIVFSSEREGNVDLYVMDADGRNQRRLTRHSAVDALPKWSDDGERIAFVSDRAGNQDIYVVDADGTNLRRVTRSDADDTDPAWAPDDDKLVFSSARDDSWNLYVMDADGSDLRRLTTSDADEWAPAWAPDGERIAFVSDRGDNVDVYATDTDGSNTRRLTRHDAEDDSPMWSPDGEHVIFASDRGFPDGGGELYAVDADGGRARQLTTLNP